MDALRIGIISSFDSTSGTASVYYPDRGSNASGDLCCLAPYGSVQTLKKGTYVAVAQLDSGGIVLGPVTAGGGTYTQDLATALAALTERVTALEERVTAVEALV